MIATTLRRPPHGQRKTSAANTRRSSSSQGSRLARVPRGVVVAAQASALAASGGTAGEASGTSARSFGRSLLAGPNTPL